MTPKQNLVSADLDPNLVAQWLQSVNAILAAVPKVALSAEDRRELAKPGQNKLEAFPALVEAQSQYPQYLPVDAFDGAELTRDLELAKGLLPLYNAVHSLDQVLSDTILAAESDAYRNALGGYALAKVGMRFAPGLSALVERLRALFDRKGRRAPVPEPVPQS